MTSLAERAMLVRLKRSMWQPYAYDDRATAAGGGRALGRFNKKLCANSPQLVSTNAAFNELYRNVNNMTVPWLDDGVRMLNSAVYFDFAAMVRHHKQLCKNEVEKLAEAWPNIIAADQTRFALAGHPELFDPTDYPTDIRSLYDVNIAMFPIPTTSDFRVTVSDEDKKEMEQAIAKAEADSATYVLGEMLEPVKKLVEKLSVPIGEPGHIFRNTLVENVLDVVNRVPALNITGDTAIASMASDIKATLLAHAQHPDVLRESPVVRERVKDTMQDIMSRMGAFMGGSNGTGGT